MKKYMFSNNEYELIENYREAFNKEETESKITDFFEMYDYILGDWSYGKLRLKGFCDKNNSNYNKINDFQGKDTYLKNSCAYDCRHFILKKVK